MIRDTRPNASLRRLVTAFAAAAAVALVVAPATSYAQSHRARLSRDVSERIEQRIAASTEIIVSANDSSIDQLVARYGARLKKRIHGGAVLEATGGQIDALSQGVGGAHNAGDSTGPPLMAGPTPGTGAGQVWGGPGGLRGFRRRGVGAGG